MIFNLVWLPARQTGSSTRTKVLLRIMLRDTTVCEDDLVKQALSLKTDSLISFQMGVLFCRSNLVGKCSSTVKRFGQLISNSSSPPECAPTMWGPSSHMANTGPPESPPDASARYSSSTP